MPLRRFNTKRFGIQNILSTPAVKGVYIIKDRYGRPQYIGKSGNLTRRLLEHFNDDQIGDARGFMAYQTKTAGAAASMEERLIRKFCPPYNGTHTEEC